MVPNILKPFMFCKKNDMFLAFFQTKYIEKKKSGKKVMGPHKERNQAKLGKTKKLSYLFQRKF